MIAICRKELTDFFTSIRFLILLFLVFIISAVTLYAAYVGIRGAGSGGFVFLRLFTTEISDVPFASLFNFINSIALFFVPIIGITLGFDAINKERSDGTLSRIISQPVFRDSVINGKFLAGIFTLTFMVTVTLLIVSGIGLRMIGVPPTSEEIVRLFFYLVFTVVYGAFWIGLAMLFSILFRGVATSLLSSIFVWLFFSFIMFFIAVVLRENEEMALLVLRFSPNWLFGQAARALLFPMVRTMGMLDISQVTYMALNPLSLTQSTLLIWPYFVGLLGLSAVCFAISYVLFMRQEVRST